MLDWNEFEDVDCHVAVAEAREHVEHCEEDWVAVTVEAEEVLVEEEDTYVGEVP